MFYAAALLSGFFATAMPSTRGARVPGLILLAVSLAAERTAPGGSSSVLKVPASLCAFPSAPWQWRP